jgi:hypothetical protein
MTKPIFANTTHQIIVNDYLKLVLSLIKELSSDSKYQNYKEVLNIIIQYHNSYGNEINVLSNNWNDWLMIIPNQTTSMTLGYLAALKNKRNEKAIETIKLLLDNSCDMLENDLMKLGSVNE